MGRASGDPDRLPRGTVTFLFSDIEGSTRLLQRLGDLYPDVLETHRRLLRRAWERNRGIEISTEGDSFFVVFENPSDAVAAAFEGQAALAGEPWPEGEHLRVRIGLHTGEAVLQSGDYAGITVHEAARITSAAHGGQILISAATRALLADRLPPDAVEDLGEHRLKDLASPHRIYQVRHPHLPEGLPPLRSLSALPNNLPQLSTAFVGRESEMTAIKDLLAAHRLVTLTGIGGTGKTRLSLQVAGDVGERFRDGVWFVELAPLKDGSLVEAAIGSVLGIRETPGRPLIETINARIRDTETLIILDNAEHIVDACARVADSVLTATVRPKLFVTSRERLGVPGEQLYPVPSLGRPDPSASGEELAEAESVRLFVDRAALSRPGFVLDGSATVVGEICRRLDGIPLAIELAAARVSVLEPDEILRRLDDRFRLLVGGARTAQPRQQTLRAAIDWSYELLSPAEQLLLSRLSVFAGGFELDAAETVCGGGIIETADMLDLVAQLVDKSLIVPHAGGRYEMLETIREYSREKLVAAGDGEHLARRHLTWCVSFAEHAYAELHGAGQIEWLDQVEVEHDNMRAGLDAAVELDPEGGLRLAAALGYFWWLRTHWREGSARLAQALREGSTEPTRARAEALRGAAGIAYMHSDYEAVRSLNEEALSISRSIGDRHGEVDSVLWLAFAAVYENDMEAALRLHNEGALLAREAGYAGGYSKALNGLGEMARVHGRLAEARALYEESLAIERTIGQGRALAVLLANLGRTIAMSGDVLDAAPHFREGLQLAREIKEWRLVAEALDEHAAVALAEGHPERAARLMGAGAKLKESVEAGLDPADRIFYEHLLAEVRSALGEEAFAGLESEGRAMKVDDAIALALGESSDPS